MNKIISESESAWGFMDSKREFLPFFQTLYSKQIVTGNWRFPPEKKSWKKHISHTILKGDNWLMSILTIILKGNVIFYEIFMF